MRTLAISNAIRGRPRSKYNRCRRRSKGGRRKRARAETSLRARYFAASPYRRAYCRRAKTSLRACLLLRHDFFRQAPVDALPLRRRRIFCRYTPSFDAFSADYTPAPTTCLPPIRPPPTCFRSDISSTDTPPPAVFKTRRLLMRRLFAALRRIAFFTKRNSNIFVIKFQHFLSISIYNSFQIYLERSDS